jgi:hypothetical protein
VVVEVVEDLVVEQQPQEILLLQVLLKEIQVVMDLVQDLTMELVVAVEQVVQELQDQEVLEDLVEQEQQTILQEVV